MSKRFLAVLALTFALAASCLVFPNTASAQQQQEYYTYVSQWAVPRAQWADFDKQQASDIPMMKKLVADGTLVDWGDLDVRVHEENGYTQASWMTATTRANLLKALELIWAGATNASYVAATKHEDYFLHTFAHGGKSASDATGYMRVGFYQSKPGASDAVRGLMTKDIKPFLDSAVADGTLLMYNLDEQDIHSAAPGAYNMALLFPDGAAMDKFFSNLASMSKSDPTVGEILDSLTVAKDHRDSLGRVVAYQHQ